MAGDPRDTDDILYNVEGHVATITLHRPEELNAFSPELLAGWEAYLRDAAQDEQVRVVVVTGSGRAFSAGGNMKRRAERDSAPDASRNPVVRRNSLRYEVHRIPQALQYLDKPYIAAVNGAAAGGGMDMACQADIRFAAESARFIMSYVRVGLIPGDGGAWLLPRLVGTATALDLIWSGRAVDADEALRIGLVSRVIPDDRLMDETYTYAEQLASGPPITMQTAKRLVHRGASTPFLESLEAAQAAMTMVQSTEDAKEGPRAFAEKRKPNFQGR